MFKDVKLWPGGGREWDWGETNTRHEPGIQPSDVEELLVHRPDIVVLSRGRGACACKPKRRLWPYLRITVSTWSSTRRRRPLRLTTVSPQRVVGWRR